VSRFAPCGAETISNGKWQVGRGKLAVASEKFFHFKFLTFNLLPDSFLFQN
jgi:hypothetical protein